MNWLQRLLGHDKLLNEVGALRQDVCKLVEVCYSKLTIYRCIICNKDFARLPSESPKRCPACVAAIQEASGLGANNRAHRGNGHDTRGVHKRAGEVGR